MKRERDLALRLQSLEMLGQAVSAMKSLSAHHFRETRALLTPARAYREGIDRLSASTGAFLPSGNGPRGLLVIGSELGFCGGYNSQVVAAAVDRRAALGDGPTFCAGRRAAVLLARRGVRVDRNYTVPTSARGLTDALLDLTQAMLGDYAAQGLSGFDAVSSRFEGIGSHRPSTTSLLPIEVVPGGGSAAVVRYVDRGHLAAIAVRELLYIEMVELLLDALASEHSARLSATEAAEHWLRDRIAHLRRRLSAARREASTQEVIEISTGARARVRLEMQRRRP